MKTYGEERSFLESCGVRVVELSDESGRARVCLVPAWQGRVMTSTAAGTGGPGYGWINRSLIASGVRKSRFNPFGGEERLWLGPEGGPFSLYFAPGAEQVYARNEKIKSDTSGGTALEKENFSDEKEYVLIESDGNEGGMIIKLIQPKIRGVAVVCEGGGSDAVRQEITQAITAVLDISASRVYITKMSA